MLQILLILRFGIDFFPAGEIKSIDSYYNRTYLLYEDGFVVINRLSKDRVFSTHIEKGRMLIYDPGYGDVYIVTEDKMLRYLEGSDHLTEIYLRGIRPKRVGVGKDFVYVEARDGYYRLRKGSFTFEKTGQVNATRWQEDLRRNDLGKYPILTPYYFTDNLLNKYYVTALNKRDRKLWVGTGLGVYLVDIVTGRREHITIGPISDVFKITDLDTVIAFMGQNQISFYVPKGDSWYYRSYLHNVVDITSFSNHVYLGTKGGLFTIRSGVTLPIFRNTILTMNQVGNIIYMHVGSRIMALTPPSNTPVEITTISERINKIAVFRNRIFFAAQDGLFYIDSLGEQHEIIDPRGHVKFGVNDILAKENQMIFLANGHLALYQDSIEYLPIDDGTSLAQGKGRVWVGTRRGVWFYRDDEIIRYHYLPKLTVYSLLEQDNHLWVASNKGLYRIPVD